MATKAFTIFSGEIAHVAAEGFFAFSKSEVKSRKRAQIFNLRQPKITTTKGREGLCSNWRVRF